MSDTPIQAEVLPPEGSQAVALRPSQAVATPGLFGTQEPVAIISKATDVATALKAVITKQGLVSRISGKEYPKCEAWTLLGTMLGVFPVLVWSRQVEGGWEARVEARTRDGATVGAAEAECLRSESNWKNRDDFALRSMAQTRATAKCLRMPLGFVMTLAGYEPTPAEEMVSDHPRKPENAPGRAGSPKPVSGPTEAPKPPPRPQSAPIFPPPVPFPTEQSRQKMLDSLKANPGQPNYDIVTEFFRKLSDPCALMPKEPLEHLELRFVPATVGQMKDLAEKLSDFGNGGQAAWPYRPHVEPANLPPGVTTTAQVVPKVVQEAEKKAKDPEWWRDVIVPIPRKGEKKVEYEKHPDTIGRLFDLRHGNDEEAEAARQRLFGLAHNWDPQPREFKGKIYQPTDADHRCREALDAFVDWFEKNHPGERL